jgi:hypothetical protein
MSTALFAIIALVAAALILLRQEKFAWKPILYSPESLCKVYDRTPGPNSVGGLDSVLPTSDRDCPDSSFTFVSDLSRFVPGQTGSGCIQLKSIEYPFCYSDSNGNYKPNYYKIEHTSW